MGVRQRKLLAGWLLWLFAAVALQAMPGLPAAQHTRHASALPRAAVYADPWVQRHVALAYANDQLTDGLGAQATRLLGLQAIACALGLPYVHTPLLKVAHTNHLVNRWNALLQPPSQPLAVAPDGANKNSSWNVVNVISLTTRTLEKLATAAAAARQPTLIRARFVHGLVNHHPTVFHCLPRCKPQPWRCSETVLHSVRVAVHIRRGDITKKEDSLRRRSLPPSYFINVTRNIAQALQSLGRDVIVEVFTESEVFFPPGSPADEWHLPTEALFKLLRDSLPNPVLLPDVDEVWSLQQMASADVLVQSISSFSTLAGLLNTRGVVVAPPVRHALHMPNWLAPDDTGGGFGAAQYGQLQQALALRYAPAAGNSSASC